jgi:prevent-host-death family protein
LVDLVNPSLIVLVMKCAATNAAKTHLSALLQEVSRGDTIVISRGRKPLAKLVPYETRSQRLRVGEMMDAPFSIPDDALRSMTAKESGARGL